MTKVTLFGADWCQQCKLIKPLLERVAEVTYINVDEDVESAAKHGVRALPTYINTENGNRGTGSVKNLEELKKVLGI